MSDILLIQAARFGDLVQTGRLIKSLYTKGELHLAVDNSLTGLASLLYPYASIYGLHFHGKPSMEKVKENLRIFASWKNINFDQVYNCNFSPLTSAICRLFTSEKVLGYRPCINSTGGIDRSPWVRFAFRMAKKRVISSLNLVDFWGNFDFYPIPPQEVNPVSMAGGKGIGIVVSGREARRSLSIHSLSNIINILNKCLNRPQFYLLGGTSEMSQAKNLLRTLAGSGIAMEDLTGRTSWHQLMERLKGLDLLISPDTGVMHLAARLGVPVMAFFMSSAWAQETGPYGLGHYIWQSAANCSPCLENNPCKERERCRDIYESREFFRLFTQFILNPEKELEFPPNLQLWKSDFDSCGQVLHLIRGEDPWKEARKTARDFMAHFLHEPIMESMTFSREWVEYCGNLFCPDEEWMLPPERYC